MFVYGASYADDFAHAQSYGWAVGTPGFDWPTLRDNKDREIARINGVYGKLLADAGARLIRGHARLRDAHRSEEHTSELQSLMRISYAVFCLTKKQHYTKNTDTDTDKHTIIRATYTNILHATQKNINT